MFLIDFLSDSFASMKHMIFQSAICSHCSLESPAISVSRTSKIEIELEALFAAVSLDDGDSSWDC